MAQTANITIERNYNGTPAYTKFNYEKYDVWHRVPVENTTVKAMEEAHQGKGKVFSNVDVLLPICSRNKVNFQ